MNIMIYDDNDDFYDDCDDNDDDDDDYDNKIGTEQEESLTQAFLSMIIMIFDDKRLIFVDYIFTKNIM